MSKPKLIITRGLPASGKTTWSKKLVTDNPNTYKRINKDDLRDMIDAGNYSKEAEYLIVTVRNTLIGFFLSRDYNVIVDDTNLNPIHINDLTKLYGDTSLVEVKDFTNVPLQECILRDSKRHKPVGESVILKMYNDFLL